MKTIFYSMHAKALKVIESCTELKHMHMAQNYCAIVCNHLWNDADRIENTSYGLTTQGICAYEIKTKLNNKICKLNSNESSSL